MAAPVSVAAALPVSRSMTCTRPASPLTPHSASLFAEPDRGRGNANPEREKPPTQPRNLPCTLRTEIEGLRVQPLFAFCGRGMLEVIQSRMDTRPCGRGGAVPSPAPLLLGNCLTETRRRQ